MTINIQYVKIPVSESLSRFTIKKLERLSTKYSWLIKAEVHFKYMKDPKGRGSICEIELSAPGPRIFGTSTEKNFELAVKETISDLDKQLKKRKAHFINY